MSSLILSVSPEIVERPYYFYMTKVRVYSIEELYYHCYHYWKQSIDDFLMGKLEDWIRVELGLSHISGQIAKIKDEFPSITEQYIRFLGLIDYFYDFELESLKKELYKWENKAEWEKCKEKADYFMAQDKPEEAMKWYKKAIVFEENAKVYNNMGVASMNMGWYEDASYYFQKAYQKEPQNIPILLNLADVYILKENFKEAGKYLTQAAKLDDSKIIWYYYGELYNSIGNKEKAIGSYLKAINKGDKFDSYIKLARIYTKEEEFEKAQDYLEKIQPSLRNEVYWMEYSNLYEAWGKKDLALEAVQNSIARNKNYIYSWIALARFHRRNKNLEEAQKAINEALRIDAENEEAKIEEAKTQKEQGKEKEYRLSLKGLINKWIHRYRQDTV
mgnify:CR=1 FL=1|jgi:tetratricopeptide (TPR) repeat protein